MNIQVYIFGNCYFGVGGIFNVPAKQPRKVAWPPAGPERERRYSARSQQPRIDAVSHQARSLILISACGMIHRATAEGFSRSAASVSLFFFSPSRRQAENVPFSFGCIPVVLIPHFYRSLLPVSPAHASSARMLCCPNYTTIGTLSAVFLQRSEASCV